ncbi:MAG: 50S ribosomal protein L6 [Betaproteobacteria bacterium]|nr:50S ribosomal protein L6 [Betaproteobacteria bacterium]
MSRVAKAPISVPQGVEVSLTESSITVKGKLGSISRAVHGSVKVTNDGGKLTFVPTDAERTSDALAGTTRALVSGMVIGVTQGFERKLTLVGVGYKAQAQGSKLNLAIGFSHPVNKEMPAGIKVETPTPTEIVIKGVDKQLVGQIAAEVRDIRPPEPYKGKGIRYADERVVIKETKKK